MGKQTTEQTQFMMQSAEQNNWKKNQKQAGAELGQAQVVRLYDIVEVVIEVEVKAEVKVEV